MLLLKMVSTQVIETLVATLFMSLPLFICRFTIVHLKRWLTRSLLILDAAIAKLPQEFYDRFTIVKSTPFYLEILKKTANKGIAVTHLAEKLSLTKEETMAIGDEENDRAMLEVVGSPVVMENGNPEIKKIAKYITKSNDESGVAYAIRKWVLD